MPDLRILDDSWAMRSGSLFFPLLARGYAKEKGVYGEECGHLW